MATPLEQKIGKDVVVLGQEFINLLRRDDLDSEIKEFLAGALGYFISDFDAIPDDIPNIGLLDDLMVFLAVAGRVQREYHAITPIFERGWLEDKENVYNRHSTLIGEHVAEMVSRNWQQKGREFLAGDLAEFLQKAEMKLEEISTLSMD